MFRPFRRKEDGQAERNGETSVEGAEEASVWDEAARNLVEQGVDPEKVERAARLLKRYAEEGVLPEGIVKPAEK